MVWHLDAAPFARELASAVEHKGAALDSSHFPAVHVLHLDDAEKIAQLLVRIRNQLERKCELLLETRVRLQAVARDSGDQSAGALEARMCLRKPAPSVVQPGVLSSG